MISAGTVDLALPAAGALIGPSSSNGQIESKTPNVTTYIFQGVQFLKSQPVTHELTLIYSLFFPLRIISLE